MPSPEGMRRCWGLNCAFCSRRKGSRPGDHGDWSNVNVGRVLYTVLEWRQKYLINHSGSQISNQVKPIAACTVRGKTKFKNKWTLATSWRGLFLTCRGENEKICTQKKGNNKSKSFVPLELCGLDKCGHECPTPQAHALATDICLKCPHQVRFGECQDTLFTRFLARVWPQLKSPTSYDLTYRQTELETCCTSVLLAWYMYNVQRT
jgi:hypothetical protein